jgi:hypothetical protein
LRTSIDKFPWKSRDTMSCNEVHNFFSSSQGLVAFEDVISAAGTYNDMDADIGNSTIIGEKKRHHPV